MNQRTRCYLRSTVCWLAIAIGLATSLPAQTDGSAASSNASADAQAAPERAWEYRPYQVRVWLCTDQSAELMANMAPLSQGIVSQLELLDASCLHVSIQQPSSRWRHAMLANISTPELLESLQDVSTLENVDKLMIVCLDKEGETLQSRVREYDILTQQWGPLGIDSIVQTEDLVSTVTAAITNAFMPIARVERISDKDEVYTRARAMKSCLITRRNEANELVVETNPNSPVCIKQHDRFLPIIRRTDRSGNLVRLEAPDFTFLTIDEQIETEAKCSIQSYHRAPLAGRTSKRAQKMALVIRPPAQPTILTLLSRDEEKSPMEGVEIWSGHPGAQKGEFEMLGHSDWEGKFTIHPSERGMRIIYLKRGSRALMKLPIIPGLYPELTAEVPNDEARLFAEGVITGLNNEILNLVAQRSLFESEILAAIEKKEHKEANRVLIQYQELPTTQRLKSRLSDEETKLKSQSTSRRELDYISAMFSTLKVILNSEATKSKERELREQLQQLSQASGLSEGSTPPANTPADDAAADEDATN